MSRPRRKAQIRAAAIARNVSLPPPEAPPFAGPPDWRAIFITALSDGRSISAAAKLAGVSRSRVYAERVRPEFVAEWDKALWFTRRRWTSTYAPRFLIEIGAIRR